MKTIIRIKNDYFNDFSNEVYKEQINYFVNEVFNCHCEIENKRFINIVEDQKNYTSCKDDFKNKTVINARGYSQSDWQTYILYHDLKQDNNDLQQLITQLERSFTHKHDYIVEKFERETIDGKEFNSEPLEFKSVYITNIEFPEKEDVLNEYISIYGYDFDESIIEID